MNDMFQEHKRQLDCGFKIAVAELTTEGTKQTEVIEIKPTEEVMKIPVYETTPEKEQQMLIERRKRQYAKFGKEYNPPRKKDVMDRKWQKEILEDNLMELRY